VPRIEDLAKSVAIGVGVGIGLAVVGGLLGGTDAGGRRRFLKSVVRGYADLKETVQRKAAETLEDLGDIMAEVEMEREAAHAEASPSPRPRRPRPRPVPPGAN
jgi:hypothetical protein